MAIPLPARIARPAGCYLSENKGIEAYRVASRSLVRPAKLGKEFDFGDTFFRELASGGDACEDHVPKVRGVQRQHPRFGTAR